MKIQLSKTEVYDLLQCLKEQKFKYMTLSALANSRKIKSKYSSNAEKLHQLHKSKHESIAILINKIVEQL